MAEIARLEQEQQEKEHFWQEDIFNLKSLLIRAPDQQTIPADRCYHVWWIGHFYSNGK